MNGKRARQIRKMVYPSGLSIRDAQYFIRSGKGTGNTGEIFRDIRRRYYKALKHISFNVRCIDDKRWLMRSASAYNAIQQRIAKLKRKKISTKKNKAELEKLQSVKFPFPIN